MIIDGKKYVRVGNKLIPYNKVDKNGKPIIQPKIVKDKDEKGKEIVRVKIPCLNIKPENNG